MREIKFRAWDIDLEDWVINTVRLCIDESEKLFVSGVADRGIVFQQFIGLKDKNGKEIYEGDILVRSSNFDGKRMKEYFLVEIKNQRFVKSIGGEGLPTILYSKGIRGDIFPNDKVIGNKFENPELLKDKKDVHLSCTKNKEEKAIA